jgi:diguanylate cyclase (GGDEF)-like protein
MEDRRPSRGEGLDVAERGQSSGVRDRTARERDVSARRRDVLSMRRDQFAEGRDKQAAALAAQNDLPDRRAESDRADAARDREQSAHDRQQAARDREQAGYDREHAGTDELTGARRRGVGLEELENEMRRARREGTSLVAAYVDVDGLKSVNDEQGHAAGDTLIRTVADGLRNHMRTYDLLVRLGGDEFLWALPNVTPAEARRRLGDLHADLQKHSRGSSVSVGLSELRDGDSSDELIERADSDLLAGRAGIS